MLLSVEAEVPLRRVTFPPRLDHAWAFTTSAVHARPFTLRPDGSLVAQAAHLKRVDQSTVALHLTGGVWWTDGRKVSVDELARCVERGLAVTGSHHTRLLERGRDRLLVSTPLRLEQLRQVLATAAFSMTPCIRDLPSRDTCGPFAIVELGAGGKSIEIRRRASDVESENVARVRILSTASVSEGMAMLRRGDLDLTRVLGGRPLHLHHHLNSGVDLVMGLRAAEASTLADELAAHLALSPLAARTGGTYKELSFESASRPDSRPSSLVTIQYTDFYPNKVVAEAIVQQLAARGISGRLHSVDYAEYLRGDIPDNGVQLEIIDPIFGVGQWFTPLLRAVSTLSAGNRIRLKGPLVNARAEIDWEQIQWGEQ